MSKEHPLVSVLIPCFNAEQWIGETLESVFSQTWSNLEVIIVNDGSTDSSRTILDRYLSRGIIIIDQPNSGQTASLNRCLSHASGEYIQYLDADDLLAADKIELQLNRLIENPDCIATAEWARFQNVKNDASFIPEETWKDMEPVHWLVTNWHDGGGMMYPAMWLLPRTIVDAIGPWREELTLINDTDYFTRAVLASRRVLFCESARSYYRSGISGSLSGLKSQQGWESQYKVIDLCEEYLLAREDSERTRRVCALLWQRMAHGCYPYNRSLANTALARSRDLHSICIMPDGGPTFNLFSRFLGWKLARTLQRISGRS